ncbi:isoprenyl transferase [Atopobacter sp. AH10]|uniref:isoprenyl transferase n=1 Tax=Atopobacter sp. AH10 TaxID=2315861 RepID=UPI000EF1CF1A|nr:isoprenyl transferase [Atopobacter sp. AH10]RLK62450.1 isoprenyl transferase [Atopobacter sp. AH10]
MMMSKIPQHIAIIMDGNGRWAKEKGLPRIAGHKKGVESIKQIAKKASQIGVKVLTLYAFSTENWSRPEKEVSFIMSLPSVFFSTFMPELIANNIQIETIGNIEALPEKTQEAIAKAKAKTAHCTGMKLCFAVNYGAEQDIVMAMNRLREEKKEGEISLIDLKSALSTSIFGANQNPDLLIRTSGEQRLSNFLLLELAYAEMYFTPVYWPDFTVEAFDKALANYAKRDRRYGGLKEDHVNEN